jgi:hypothetical protein
VTDLEIPQERDLPAGRLIQLKDELMTQIQQDLDVEVPPASGRARVDSRRGWRRIGLVAAAVAAGLALATPLVLSGHEPASANTAVRTADGGILITIREGKHPKDLQRRLTALGVPAVVDFLESGTECDRARSTGWVNEPRGEDLFTWADDAPDGEAQLILHPDELKPDETAVFQFYIDEVGDDMAANVVLSLTTTPVGPCTLVPSSNIVDAENGVAGG